MVSPELPDSGNAWRNTRRPGGSKASTGLEMNCFVGKDDLAEWAKGTFDGAFAATNQTPVLAAFGKIMTWVQSQNQFIEAAKAQFAGCADGWLVAYASVHGLVVVTHEKYSADARNRVKIPNVCKAFSVAYVDTWTMLRGLGAKLG